MTYTQNRELSWLAFNERVLEEGAREEVPALERLKFIAIFDSNLDEFFMVRVGSLFDLSNLKKEGLDNKTGMTTSQQLDAIYERMPALYKMKDRVYQELTPTLRALDICNLKYDELSKSEKKYVDDYFYNHVFPVISPLILDSRHPFPHLANNSLYITATMGFDKKHTAIGLINISAILDEAIFFPDSTHFILVEEVLLAHVEEIFQGFEVSSKGVICVTRNADINLEEEIDDADENFRQQMKKALRKRGRLAPVRLEVQGDVPGSTVDYLVKKLNIKSTQVYRTESPLRMDFTYEIFGKVSDQVSKVATYPPFSPMDSSDLDLGRPMMEQVLERDRLLHYPYDSMEPFLRLLKEAAFDESVISIRITIYRLSSISKVAEYLSQAAENDKEVTVLMELRARFDEKNNIDWSEHLENAGCTIIYGFEDYKVHSKICLITRHVNNKVQYITQIGTGNYNEKTAKLYTDFSLMTGNQQIGKDAMQFFRNMLISNLDGEYRHLVAAPFQMKPMLMRAIDDEIQRNATTGDGRIVIKCNSVTERDLIDKLVEASRAGVKVHLLVRGICCVLPGIKGHTENIRVTSIVGRFLEHHRVYMFGPEDSDEQKVYISSADFMTRNISRRVELACPIYDTVIKKKLQADMGIMLGDSVKAKELFADGWYQPVAGDGTINAQVRFMELAIKKAAAKKERLGREDSVKKPRFTQVYVEESPKVSPVVDEDSPEVSVEPELTIVEMPRDRVSADEDLPVVVRKKGLFARIIEAIFGRKR